MKNIDYVVLKTARDLDLPKDQIKQVIDAYWDSVYKKLLSLESTTVCIRNVGLITVSKYKLKKFILRYIDKIRKMEKSERFPPEEKKKILDNYREKLRKALVQRNLIAIKYYDKFKNI